MTWLSRILGHDIERQPYMTTVIYNGALDTFPFYAQDMREALDLTAKLMPQRAMPPLRIEIVKQ